MKVWKFGCGRVWWGAIFCFIVGIQSPAHGFKLEKDIRELSRTEARKVPPGEDQGKVKEVPATPQFKMESFDGFMTDGPLQKSKMETAAKSGKSKSKTKKKSRI